MSRFILKFGGSSVADVERIRHAASLVAEQAKTGHELVVVVSAMQGETDRLIGLSESFGVSEQGREYAALLSTGEQVSATLFSLALSELGYLAESYTGAQLPINTSNSYQKARIMNVKTTRLEQALEKGVIPVVAGFQGVNQAGEVTTFGRGGSDLTAVALAAALGADECRIYTDVDGVYTSDPRIVPSARRLDHVTFEEVMELAGLGAKVLHNRSLELAGKERVSVRVLSSLGSASTGTLISFDEHRAEQPVVSGVAFDRKQATLSLKGIPDRPGLASYILSAIGEADIEVDMIMQSEPSSDSRIDFSCTVNRDDFKKVFSILDHLKRELFAQKLVGYDQIAKLSLVGVGMRSHAGIASKMFSALGEEGVKIHFLTASEVKISAIIDEKYLELAARALHSAFGLDQ